MIENQLNSVERRANWIRDGKALRVRGGQPLNGQVAIQGSKNSAQKLVPMCATVGGVYRLRNLPLISDTFAVLRIMDHLDAKISFDGDDIVIDTREIVTRPIDRALTVRSTGTFHYASALLSRFGQVKIARPGGDRIGGRPVNFHLDVFEQFGAEVTEDADGYEIRYRRRPDGDREITLPIPSAGVLVNAVICASVAQGRTMITNVPYDTDIQAALGFAGETGARITVHTDAGKVDAIEVSPADTQPDEVFFHTPPDRNDAATWLIAAAAGAELVELTNVPVADLGPLVDFLSSIGSQFEVFAEEQRILVRAAELRTDGVDLHVGPSPGFHSDWGQLALILLITGNGSSRLADYMYEGRYTQVQDLVGMGAKLELVTAPVSKGELMYDREAVEMSAVAVTAVPRLHGATVTGRDVRGAASLVIAAAVAEGETYIHGIDQLGRGYELMDTRLRALGVDCEVV
jgi:UDP-N-acetylglucosamine 1-carboxyvinyltransferase